MGLRPFLRARCRSSRLSRHDVDLLRIAGARGRARRGACDGVAELPAIEERVNRHSELLLPPGALPTRRPAPGRRGAEALRLLDIHGREVAGAGATAERDLDV